MERHVGMGERQVGLEKDRWGWGETGGLGYLAVFRRSSGCWYFLSL